MRFCRTARFLILPVLAGLLLAACGGGGSDAPAPPPAPTVNTTAASSIATDNAILNGTVNPNAQATTAWFEWGTDNALSSFTKTADQLIGAGSTSVTVSVAITGLTSGAKYYYRAAASNASGTQKGAITSFTCATPNSPPTVTTVAADNVTTSGATLHGTVIPNELATTALFEWGTDSNLTTFSSTVAQSMGNGKVSVPVSQALSSLNPATKYYFRVAATNSIGTSRGTILSFDTTAQAPTVITQAATSITASGATLNGNVNPNGLATSAQFEYGTDNTMAVFTTTAPQNMGNGTTGQALNAAVTSLSAGTRHYFRVSATNLAGTTKGTTVFFDTPQNPPPVANAGPNQTVFMLNGAGPTVVTLDGSGSSDAFGTITSYQWSQIAGPSVTLDNTNPVKPTFSAPTVTSPSQNLQFRLTVTDNRGLSSTADVTITVKWCFGDDFNTNTLGGYTVTPVGTGSAFLYDSGGKRAQATSGNDNNLTFSHSFPDSNTGVFSIDFSPTAKFPSGGGIWVRIIKDANNYYQISNFDWDTPPGPEQASVIKVLNGVAVDNVAITNAYSQGNTYSIKITFSPTLTTVVAFGQTINLNANAASITSNKFEVSAGQQEAYFDNIQLEAKP